MMFPNNGRSDTQQSFKKKQSKPQQETKSKQFLQLPTGTALPNQHKRNSFHGYASSSSDFYSPSQSTLIVSMMNGSNSYGSSLLQNGHNWSAVGSQEPLASLTLSGTSLASSKMRSKCSLLRLEDGGNMETSSINNNNNHHMSSSNMTSSNNHQIQHQTAAMARTAKALHQQQARQHGSTDSAPAAAVNGERKKRMELWALAPSSAFHQSIDMRTSADVSALSNSCGHIVAAEAAPTASRTSSTNNAATTVAAIDVAASSGYHSERRSAICPGDTSRDHGRHHGSCRGGGGISSQLLLFCTASGCSGHAPCIGHQPPALRSTQSSIDDSTGESGLTGQLRDTYLTEISREWMRMNGAIAPFRNILQPASSVASTPLPNHRPMIQSPAAPATTTATAILKGKATAEEEFGGGGYTVEAIQGSCHNLATVTAATTTEQRIVDQFVRPRPKDCGIANDVAAGNGSGDAIIINEPETMSQKRYGRRTPSGPLESLDKIFVRPPPFPSSSDNSP